MNGKWNLSLQFSLQATLVNKSLSLQKTGFMSKYFVCLFIIMAACKKDSGPDATPIDKNGEILFISRRVLNSADWQMVLMNADGTNQRTVSNVLVRCAPPVLSNSRKKIAFTTLDPDFNYVLYVIDIDGQNQKVLSKGKEYCGSPSWSPDDSKIVFVKNESNTGGANDIYTINVDGSNEIRLTTQFNNFSPVYLPNYNSIIFSSSEGAWAGIYKIDADGGNRQLLTPKNKSFGDPKVSPNGKNIAITSGDMNGSQIFVMNPDGSELKQLTFTVSSKYYDTGFPRDGNCNPVWAPEGNKLAYVSFENGSPDIFVINANGKGNKRLTDTPLRDENPCWTEDGNHILFSSNRNLNLSAEIYIMKSQGQSQTPLTGYIADDIYPTFINK